MNPGKIFNAVIAAVVCVTVMAAGLWVYRWLEKDRVLRQVVERLSADSRVAEVLVTKSEYDEQSKRIRTTIKFLEYDTAGQPLEPKYFSFLGNIIQFQALVIRFDDKLVEMGDRLRGKSAYLFLKAFVLDGEKTQSFDITENNEIPAGYKIPHADSEFEKEVWNRFWDYALKPEMRENAGIKNAQIEAPGSMFLPGTIYTIRIEHDGGLRIDTAPIPAILKGETV
ncbi:MAG: hypothetical protein H6757_04620 [Candidatus Omnitrophica bacterium]|nr:hypothetical protein [Candidatus Omnitrophota bacterium]